MNEGIGGGNVLGGGRLRMPVIVDKKAVYMGAE